MVLIFGSLVEGPNGNVFIVAVVWVLGVTLVNLTIDVWFAFISASLIYNQRQSDKPSDSLGNESWFSSIAKPLIKRGIKRSFQAVYHWIAKKTESSWCASFMTILFHILPLVCKSFCSTAVGNADYRADHCCHHIAIIFWSTLGSRGCIS